MFRVTEYCSLGQKDILPWDRSYILYFANITTSKKAGVFKSREFVYELLILNRSYSPHLAKLVADRSMGQADVTGWIEKIVNHRIRLQGMHSRFAKYFGVVLYRCTWSWRANPPCCCIWLINFFCMMLATRVLHRTPFDYRVKLGNKNGNQLFKRLFWYFLLGYANKLCHLVIVSFPKEKD